MASQLTTISVRARQSIRWGIYVIIFLIVGRFALNFAIGVYNNVKPPAKAPPTLGFGKKLAAIEFPDQSSELPTFSYTVETTDGLLPIFPEQMAVYAFEQKAANLLSYEKMVDKAKAFGFGAEPQQLSERIYRFTHTRVPSVLETDQITDSFSLSFNLNADTTPLNFRSPTVSTGQERIIDKLREADLYYPDLVNGPKEHIFLKAAGDNLTKALSLSEAQLVQISLFRQGIGPDENRIPMVTPNPEKGNVWFFVSGSGDRDKQIIAGEYRYFPLDLELAHTYPIRTAEEALQDLADGNGYIANLGRNVDGKVVIDDIYLGYYDPNVPTTLMQPVVVIEGRDDFVAYVPAIAHENIASPEGN